MIIDLNEDKSMLRRLKGLVFDVAWIQQQYPFGGPSHAPHILLRGDLLPAAIAPMVVLRKYFAFVSFSAPNGAD
jgi:hypothetical protein